MADNEQGEKTEDPTQQRREDFRKRGQVAQTKELASVLLLLSSMLLMWSLGRFFLKQLHDVFYHSFGDFLITAARDGGWAVACKFAVEKTFMIVGPFMAMLWVLSFAASVIQVGFMYNEEALQIKPERIDPMQGLKRIFSLRSLMEGVKAVLKVSVVTTIVVLVIRSEVFTVPQLVTYSVEQLFVFMGDVIVKLVGGVGVFMAVLAGLDFMFQRWDLEQQMKMTKQEVKEEHKSREGDPLIKARIRRTQREMATRRMMDDVPTADVIVTNPTHIAVALKYDQTMVSPKIVAMGADHIAEKIKTLARDHNIPIVENKPLARTIYKTLKIGEQIPRELYTAVAEVLSYVYRLKRKVKK